MNHHHFGSGSPLVVLSLLATLLFSFFAGCNRPTSVDTSYATRLRTDVGEVSRYLFADPGKALANGQHLLATATDSNLYYGTKSAMALAYVLAGKSDSARLFGHQVDRYLEANPEIYVVQELHNYHKSLYHNITADLDSSIYYANRAFEFAKLYADYHQAAVDLSIIGEAREMLGRPVEAVSTYRMTMTLADSVGDPDIVCYRTLIGLAATYSSIGNYDMADNYFDTIAASLKEMTEVGPHFIYYSTLGTSLYNRERYKDAIDVFHKAYVYADSIHNINFIGVAQANLAELHMLTGQLDSAEYYLERAEQNLCAHGAIDTNQLFYLNSLKGDLELRKGYAQEAYKWLQKASADTLRVLPRYQAFHYQRLARYYTYIADYISSIEYMTRARAIDDSIKNRSAYYYTAELEYRYQQDTTVLRSKVRFQEKVKEVNHLRLVIIAIILFVTIVTLGIFLRVVILKRRHTLEAMKLSNDIQRLRMKNISNRISSHFIFNLLNEGNIPYNDKIKDVNELIRQNLEINNKSLVTIREELNFIGQFIKVERQTLGDDFTYEVNIGEGVDEQRLVPAMMLEIFVENSLKHGLRGYEGPKFLRIGLKYVDHALVIEVVNNGRMSSTAAGTGTGLRVIYQTIHLLNIHNRHKMHISQGVDEADRVYRVTLSIPDSFTFATLI